MNHGMMHFESVTTYEKPATSPTHSDTQTTPASKKLYKCPQRGCERHFHRKFTLVEHVKTHTGEKPHVCPVRSCNKRFSTSGNLSRHKRLHGYIKPIECPVDGCYCTFPSDNKLDKHMQFHLGSPVHVCTIDNCGKTFSTTGNLNRHAKHHHPNQNLRPIPPLNAPLLTPPPMDPQLSVQIPPQYPVDMGYPFLSPRVNNPRMKRVMDVEPPTFTPGVAQQYDGLSRWSRDFNRPNVAQVMPTQMLPPLGTIPRATRNVGITNVVSSTYDEVEVSSTDPGKLQPALRSHNLLDDMVNFHVAHIEL